MSSFYFIGVSSLTKGCQEVDDFLSGGGRILCVELICLHWDIDILQKRAGGMWCRTLFDLLDKKTFNMVPHFHFKITIKAVGIFCVMNLR